MSGQTSTAASISLEFFSRWHRLGEPHQPRTESRSPRPAPNQNPLLLEPLSRWMNDPALTPVLEKMLAITARRLRAIEHGAIVDSSKMSQMLSALSRWVEYGDDEREEADWMKMHALVGIETLVCMAVAFSGTVGAGTHDINFLLPLVRKTRGLFDLRFLLADKAYLSEDVVGRLWEMGMQAVYVKRQADFHEIYRLRPKIEACFSLVKRVSTGFCWSRGRKRKDADGVIVGEPSRTVHGVEKRDALQGHLREPAPDRQVRVRNRVPHEPYSRYVLS